LHVREPAQHVRSTCYHASGIARRVLCNPTAILKETEGLFEHHAFVIMLALHGINLTLNLQQAPLPTYLPEKLNNRPVSRSATD
jgi:hypothetical protein